MSRAELLTVREREVLQLLAHGHTNREVADRLRISVRTAEWHRASIRRKLDLASRAALVAFAFAHDLAHPASTIAGGLESEISVSHAAHLNP
jgi:DNA-binding CsgD family transcriptional regulator